MKLGSATALVCLLGFLLSYSLAPLGAKPQKARVEHLVKLLDDDSFEVRERATEELKAMGREYVPVLRTALKNTSSFDDCDRLSRILEWHRIRLEWFTDRAAFLKRLARPVRTVDFDDVDTSKTPIVKFEANRYQKRAEILISGVGGQFASRTFGFPKDYRPSSGNNAFAPGPSAPVQAGKGAGGYHTTLTFGRAKRALTTRGFGVVFIDADHPQIGPSGFEVFDASGDLLGVSPIIRGANASQVFCGVIAVDRSGAILPSIAKIRITNGCNWAGCKGGEGVVLDDLVFAVPELKK